jgi:hypothetical protein
MQIAKAAKKSRHLRRWRPQSSILLLDLVYAIAGLGLVDSILRPCFLAAVERKLRIECFCQSVAFTISARVAHLGAPDQFKDLCALALGARRAGFLGVAGLLDQRTALEYQADVFHAFRSAPLEVFDWTQLEHFNRRRLDFAEFLADFDLADAAFDALIKQGSSAGFYMRALKMSGLPESAEKIEDHATQLDQALRYLEENKSYIRTDNRCLELLLDVWWMVHNRTQLMRREERVSCALGPAEWTEVLQIVTEIEATKQSTRPATLAFVRGLALFHLGSVAPSIAVFRELERESELVRGPRRIIRSYLASTREGVPQKFRGQVKRVSADTNRGEVYVETLRTSIPFLPLEFGRPDIKTGEDLGEFQIAFNFRGPIADPITPRKRSSRE